jgi:hypothetical protein
MAQISIATSKDERSAHFCPVSLNWAIKNTIAVMNIFETNIATVK